ncbi:ABC transporter permease [Spartinivicinus poritis]|uniref:Arginine ABC transporter permease protein ArtM n=1 Tax=Spartinivicinus poritis TaxID=2994640 RepID=A0ABT5UBW6_9GAMM|nr:ABC transporter permease [Spartinivicinus sp. A2-2]MDE1463880.1 ABC transporter permease [Spartinivicinus sp. A2-2]
MDFDIIKDNYPQLLEGLLLTVELVSLSLLIGFILAVPMALMRNGKNVFLRWFAWGFIYFFRGTPLLVQLYLIYYGIGQAEWVRDTILWGFFKEAYLCALLAFTLNTAAYTAEILRGAINTTDRGEIEAAKAYGMTPWQTFYRIVFPSAFRRALPAYGNEVIFMLHGSAIASAVTLVDLTGAAKLIYSTYYSPFEAFIAAGVLYMIVTFFIVGGFKMLERRWHAHLRPRT